jgi:hypothetical protein
MKMKLQNNSEPQAGICTVLYAVAPETQFKHGHRGFGLSFGQRGLCAGAVSFPVNCEQPLGKCLNGNWQYVDSEGLAHVLDDLVCEEQQF